MKKLSIFFLILMNVIENVVIAQSVLIRPNSASPLSVKSSVTNYGNISTTSSNANLVFRINEPANGSGASGSITGAIESSGTEVSYNGYSGDVGLYGSVRLRLGTNNNRDRMIMLSNGNVGINWPTPIAKFQVYKTGSAATGWGGYVSPLKAGVMIDGTHESLNEEYDAIGVAGHGNWAARGYPGTSLTRRNIGLLGTAGNTATENVGVYGYINQTGGNGHSYYGVKGEVNSNSNFTSAPSYGVYGSSNSSSGHSYGVQGYSVKSANSSGASYGVQGISVNNGISDSYGIYAYASGNSTGSKYGIFATAEGSGTRYAGYFLGNVTVAGTFSNPSDERFKKNLNNIEGALGKIMQLIPAAYEYKTDEFSKMNFSQGKHYGFTAQNVKKVFPQLVSESALPFHSGKGEATEQYLSVNYLELIPVLTKAIQEQQLVIEKLKEEVRKLRK